MVVLCLPLGSELFEVHANFALEAPATWVLLVSTKVVCITVDFSHHLPLDIPIPIWSGL